MPKVAWLRCGGGGARTRVLSHSYESGCRHRASPSEIPARSPCWCCLMLGVMETDVDRLRRVSTAVMSHPWLFFGKGIKGSALGRHAFLAVGLVPRSLHQWVSAFGSPMSVHPYRTHTLGDPANFPPHGRLRNGHQSQSLAQVRAAALGPQFGWFYSVDSRVCSQGPDSMGQGQGLESAF